MCDESIIADCLVHGCLQLECTITRVYMSVAFFVGILPDSSKLRDIAWYLWAPMEGAPWGGTLSTT